VTAPPPASAEAVSVIVLDIVGRPDVGDPPVLRADYAIFTDSLPVTIHTDQANVDVHYTMDGSEPTAQSPRVTGPVTLTQTTTLKARSFRGERPVSPTGTAAFRRVPPRAAEAVPDAQPGLAYAYYEGEFDRLPDFSSLSAVASGVADVFSIQPARRDDLWALCFEGFAKVPKTGVYRIYLRSDDGSRLWIGDELVVENDGLHSSLEKSGVIALEAGLHPIRVAMFERTGGAELVVSWESPGLPRHDIPPAVLRHRPRR